MEDIDDLAAHLRPVAMHDLVECALLSNLQLEHPEPHLVRLGQLLTTRGRTGGHLALGVGCPTGQGLVHPELDQSPGVLQRDRPGEAEDVADRTTAGDESMLVRVANDLTILGDAVPVDRMHLGLLA